MARNNKKIIHYVKELSSLIVIEISILFTNVIFRVVNELVIDYCDFWSWNVIIDEICSDDEQHHEQGLDLYFDHHLH
jgi:hypothetical protein